MFVCSFFSKTLQNTILACCSQALIRMAHNALNYRTNWARTKSYSASRSYFAVVNGVTSFPWVFRTGWWVVVFGALKSTSTTKNNTLVWETWYFYLRQKSGFVPSESFKVTRSWNSMYVYSSVDTCSPLRSFLIINGKDNLCSQS